MGTIKTTLPDNVEREFRKKAAVRFGLRRGVLNEATTSAIRRWSGREPILHISQTRLGLSCDVQVDKLSKTLWSILNIVRPQGTFTVSAKARLDETIEGMVEVDRDEKGGFSLLHGRLEMDDEGKLERILRKLVHPSDLRIEYSGNFEISLGEEGCLSLSSLEKDTERKIIQAILMVHGLSVSIPGGAMEIVVWGTDDIEVIERG